MQLVRHLGTLPIRLNNRANLNLNTCVHGNVRFKITGM
jgi:hypothetical protein